jgi:hypothetical protein
MMMCKSFLRLGVFLIVLAVPPLAVGQSNGASAGNEITPPPCGTVTKSIKLNGDCLAPLRIGANNIKVNLNGYSVLQQPDEAGAEVIGRRGVTITNGKIRGVTVGLLVRNGGHHTLSNLQIFSEGEQTSNVEVVNVDRVKINRVFCIDPRFDVTAFRFSGKSSKISHVSCFGLNSSAFIAGDRLTISDNIFRVAGGYETLGALRYAGRKSTISRNLIVGDSTRPNLPSLQIDGDANIVKSNVVVGYVSGIGLKSGSERNTIRNNIVSIDDRALDSVGIDGGDSACANTWRDNEFISDSEGDGPSEGCIR